MVHVASPLRTRGSLASLLLASFLISSCGNDAVEKPGVDPDTAMTAKTCALTCRDLKNCQLSCATTDTACSRECDSYASVEVKSTYAAAIACVNAHGCKDDACIAQFCAAPVAACLPPIPTEVQPPKFCAPICNQLVGCMIQCHDDATCSQSCIDTAIPSARRDYQAALACVKAHGCDDLRDNRCDMSACVDLLDRCR